MAGEGISRHDPDRQLDIFASRFSAALPNSCYLLNVSNGTYHKSVYQSVHDLK